MGFHVEDMYRVTPTGFASITARHRSERCVDPSRLAGSEIAYHVECQPASVGIA